MKSMFFTLCEPTARFTFHRIYTDYQGKTMNLSSEEHSSKVIGEITSMEIRF